MIRRRRWYTVTDEHGEYYPEFIFVNHQNDRQISISIYYVELGAKI